MVPADDLSLVGFEEVALEDGELEADPLEEEELGWAALGEGEAALLEVVVSAGLAVLVVLLAAVELAAGEPFPRRRDRLFLAPL